MQQNAATESTTMQQNETWKIEWCKTDADECKTDAACSNFAQLNWWPLPSLSDHSFAGRHWEFFHLGFLAQQLRWAKYVLAERNAADTAECNVKMQQIQMQSAIVTELKCKMQQNATRKQNVASHTDAANSTKCSKCTVVECSRINKMQQAKMQQNVEITVVLNSASILQQLNPKFPCFYLLYLQVLNSHENTLPNNTKLTAVTTKCMKTRLLLQRN